MQAIGDSVLIKKVKPKQGLILTTEEEDLTNKGLVVSVGDEYKEPIKVGDFVMFDRFEASAFEHEDEIYFKTARIIAVIPEEGETKIGHDTQTKLDFVQPYEMKNGEKVKNQKYEELYGSIDNFGKVAEESNNDKIMKEIYYEQDQYNKFKKNGPKYK